MNTERLHAITRALREEIRQTNIEKTLQRLTSALKSQVGERVLPASVHEIGGRPAYGHGREDGSWHD
jgi:hypothetical protein